MGKPALSLTFTGGPELVQALRTLPESVQGRVLLEALKRAAQPVIEDAARLAPRRRAAGVAASLVIEVVRGADGGKTIAVGPDPAHFYGIFLEFGTRHMPARPFMRPAWDAQVQKVLDQLVGELRAAIERAARRHGRRR